MSDPFKSLQPGLESPATQLRSLTPNDVTDLDRPTRGLYLGSGGTVVVTLLGDATADKVTLVNLAAGGVHGLRVKRLWATGTDAADIVGIY